MNDYVEVTIRLKAEVVAALERHYATLSIEDIVTVNMYGLEDKLNIEISNELVET